jgi:CRISPR/Cas system-associated exonuclease Cas4 (RecB family)
MARKKVLFSPDLQEPFRLSRSKIDLYLNCPRCFYLDRRLGVGQPSSPPFSLNNAVDELLKKEFDVYRRLQQPHPLCIENRIEAIPYQHPDLDRWRSSLHAGIDYCMPGTNLKICGGVDDVWINSSGELIIVDYKATSKKTEVSLDEDWQIAYKRQMEIYQWLFRKNGFTVNPMGYFVYCNGVSSAERFDATLRFSIKVIGYKGVDTWIDSTIRELYACLSAPEIPPAGPACAYCSYRQAAGAVERRGV